MWPADLSVFSTNVNLVYSIQLVLISLKSYCLAFVVFYINFVTFVAWHITSLTIGQYAIILLNL
jgi:hypothetical protein